MKYSLSLRKTISTFLLISGLGLLSVSTVSASLIIASGDSTPAFYAGDNDNNAFFTNILEGGSSVLTHELATAGIGGNLNSFYNGLTGVSSSYLDNSAIDSSLLAGIDLFVTGLREGGFSTDELNALNSFISSGGSVMFMGEYTYAFTDINNALASIGSSMSLFGAISDIGTNYAGVAADTLTAGVSTYHYGATYGVSGGTSLFTDSNQRTFTAYESTSVPEAASLYLLVFGLLGLLGAAKRKN